MSNNQKAPGWGNTQVHFGRIWFRCVPAHPDGSASSSGQAPPERDELWRCPRVLCRCRAETLWRCPPASDACCASVLSRPGSRPSAAAGVLQHFTGSHSGSLRENLYYTELSAPVVVFTLAYSAVNIHSQKMSFLQLNSRCGVSPSLTSWLCVDSFSFSVDIITCQVVILASASRPKPSTLLQTQTNKNKQITTVAEGGVQGVKGSRIVLLLCSRKSELQNDRTAAASAFCDEPFNRAGEKNEQSE